MSKIMLFSKSQLFRAMPLHFIPWLLSAGIAIVLVSTDIYAPSLPSMVEHFVATEADLQWTFSINSYGYCFVSPLVGPLADAIGRRTVLLVSFLCFIGASIGCAMAPTLDLFYFWRFVQGAGSAAIPIVSIAVLSDVLKGREFASMMAYVGIVITLSFAIGPLIGGVVAEYYGWRILFYGCSAAGVLIFVLYFLCLPETLVVKTKFNLKKSINTYRKMFCNQRFMLYGMITSFMLTGFFAYITSSSYLYINEFGLTRSEFGILTSIGMVANAGAHLVVGKLTLTYGERLILRCGIAFVTTAAVIMACMTMVNVTSPYILLVPVVIYNLALGFTFPPAMTLALSQFPENTGAASAFLGTFRMILLGTGSYLGGYFYNGELSSLSSLMILFTGLVVACFLTVSTINARLDKKQ